MSANGKERSLPFYWAAPVLSGQVMVFNSATHLHLDYLLLIVGLILFVAAVLIVVAALRPVTYTTSSTG
jgi:hypothetical protein